MRYGSICSGIECATVAWHRLGWVPAFFAEVDPFCCAVLGHHYPGVPNLGDFTRIGPDAGPVDLLVGGTPCFPGGTLVLTDSGLRPIEMIGVGDRVLTHRGRYRTVLRTGSKRSETVLMRGQGHPGLEVTAEHPFWSTAYERRWIIGSKKKGGPCRERVFEEPSWRPTSAMEGRFWAYPVNHPDLPIPEIEAAGRESHVPPIGADFFWMVGLWLGDGWARVDTRKGYVLICARKEQAPYIAMRLAQADILFSISEQRTTRRFQISSRPLARWLRLNFGAGSRGKTIPAWCLGMQRGYRESLLEGYCFADGCKIRNGRAITTISPSLAVGTKLLATSLGLSASVKLCTPMRKGGAGRTVIEGRGVNESPFYQVVIYDSARSAVNLGDWHFGLVREVRSSGEEKDVYNLEVEEDQSYTADGIVVHNCQSFSVAGGRLGLDDPRGNLAVEFLRLARRLRPRWLVWENVPGVLSSGGGRDLGAFLGLLGELGYGWAYRVLDAQYVRVDGFRSAVPQRRRRVFVVGYLGGDWRPPAAVLFEPGCLSGDPPPRRAAGAVVARCLKVQPGSGGRLGSDGQDTLIPDVAHCLASGNGYSGRMDPTKDTLVAHTLRGVVSDASEDGTGRGVPLVPYNIVGSAQEGRNHAFEASVSGFLRHKGLRPTGNEAGTVVAFQERGRAEGRRLECQEGVSYALRAVDGGGCGDWFRVATHSSVRRLTPREAERLMGLPDDYTLVSFRGKPAKDGPRYRAIGNGMAVNVIRWLGMRIGMVEGILCEQRSHDITCEEIIR